jgi:hypothetical protein
MWAGRAVVQLLRCCLVYAADFRGRIDGAKCQSMTSVGEVTAEEGRGRKCFYCAPSRDSNRQLSLIRRVWYHKTTASVGFSTVQSLTGYRRELFPLCQKNKNDKMLLTHAPL